MGAFYCVYQAVSEAVGMLSTPLLLCFGPKAWVLLPSCSDVFSSIIYWKMGVKNFWISITGCL